MILRLILCLALTACSSQPQVNWPAGPIGPTPDLVPLDGLVDGAATVDSRGEDLAARAAALKVRAAAIGG